MTATAPPAFVLRAGTQTIPADAVHHTPLGYDRRSLPVGAPLPLPPSAELVDRLSECDTITVAFHGKLGDTLLSLSAVRALSDWLALWARPSPVRFVATGPYAPLIARTGLADINGNPESPDVVIGDWAALRAYGPQVNSSVVCDPAAPPCWSSDGYAYPDMPARHYLAIERRLGFRLPAMSPFAPLLTTGPNALAEQLHSSGWLNGPTIAAITATSWAARKDYTAERFTDVAQRLAERQRTHINLLLIGGQHTQDVRIASTTAQRNVRILHLDGIHADDLAHLFPLCDLVLGNDTGLTHLAALSRRPGGGGPPVISLYARHSHSKWRTGQPHHHAIATGFSERMHQGDLCPVRDALATTTDADLSAITTDAVADICAQLLNGDGP